MNAALATLINQEEAWMLSRELRLSIAKSAAQRGDILLWGQMLFPEKFSMAFCPDLHGYFVSIRHKPRTCTEAPRGHAKTTIKCFLILIFQAIHEATKFTHYLNVQSTTEKAMSVNRSIKYEFESNDLLADYLRRNFGTGDYRGERWTDQQFVLRNGVVFSCIGAGQSTRGINYRNTRPDYIVADDLYDEEDINNVDATIKRNDWFWGTLYPARTNSKECCVHLQGTAINGEDLLANLSSNGNWMFKSFQAITDWGKQTLLWPTRWNTWDRLMADKEDMGSVIFNREMQNERRDDAESIVKQKWLEGWEYEPRDLPKFDQEFTLVASRIGCDPSIGEKNENDYTGMSVMYKTQYKDSREPDYYIDALENKHLSLVERCNLIQKHIDSRHSSPFRITKVYVEGIAGFKDFAAEVRRKCTVGVEEIDKVPDKLTHLENKSHYFENRKVHLNKHIDPALKKMLKYQLTTNHPKNDDLRDSVLLPMDHKSRSWSAFV